MEYSFTKKAEAAFGVHAKELKSFYAREDFVVKLGGLRRATTDNKFFRQHELQEMCGAMGVNMQELLKNEAAVLQTIPDRRTLNRQILSMLSQTLHELYTQVPSSQNYMERVVRRLAREYGSDPVRVAILKKFLAGGENFKTYKTEKIRALNGGVVDDSIFTRERLNPELSDREVLKVIVKRQQKMDTLKLVDPATGGPVAYGGLKLPEEVLEQLRQFVRAAGLIPEKSGEGLLLQAQALALPDTDLPFMRDLKDAYTRHLKGLCYTMKNGKTDNAAVLLKDNLKDAKDAKGVDWALLKLCDDLANGKFYDNGKTRVALYHFALAFGMTLKLTPEDPWDPERDIRKNLFEDYYGDNLVRFLQKEYTDAKFLSETEKEPSGEGINFKNYAESIYLYYLYRQDLPLTPCERIDRAEKAITQCVKKSKTYTGPGPDLLRQDQTRMYRDAFVDFVVDAPEDQLVDRILENYYVDTDKGTRIGVANQENTAYDTLIAYLEQLEAGSVGRYGNTQKHLVRDNRDSDQVLFHWGLADCLKDIYPDDPDFLRLVEKLDERMNRELKVMDLRRGCGLVYTLQTLLLQKEPQRLETLLRRVQSLDGAVDKKQLEEAVLLLGKLGFDIRSKLQTDDVRRKNGDGWVTVQEDRAYYWLESREYADPVMNTVLQKLSNPYTAPVEKVRQILVELLEEQGLIERYVNRSALMSVLASYYVATMDTDNYADDLRSLYEGFGELVNLPLEEARFQPFHEKNILDLYVILAIYLHIWMDKF